MQVMNLSHCSNFVKAQQKLKRTQTSQSMHFFRISRIITPKCIQHLNYLMSIFHRRFTKNTAFPAPVASSLIRTFLTTPLSARLFTSPKIDEGTVDKNDNNALSNDNSGCTIDSVPLSKSRVSLSNNLEKTNTGSINQNTQKSIL